MEELTLLGAGKTEYPATPDQAVLETFPNPYPGVSYEIMLDCPEFTSVCPRTGQPDFGHLVVRYSPNAQCLESKAVKLYLFAFRNTGAFWERLINRVADDLFWACAPHWLEVRGKMNPRGGIALEVLARRPVGHASV